MGSTVLLLAILATSAADGRTEPVESVDAVVTAESLDVLDGPSDSAYTVVVLKKDARLRVRVDLASRPGWAAVEAPGTAFCWVEEAAIRRSTDARSPDRAFVETPSAVVRSANVEARSPGPPCASLRKGDAVVLIDRPPLDAGGEGKPKRWLAIAPPAAARFYVPADGIGWEGGSRPPAPAEIRASFQPAADDRHGEDVEGELKRIDGMILVVTTGQPVEKWDLTQPRRACEDLLERVKGRTAFEDEVKVRMSRLDRYEKAAEAARKFVVLASKSRRRDAAVARIQESLAGLQEDRRRAYDAIGFIQPSSREIEGRKMYALIGREGVAVAYLDIPAGLDPSPLKAHRVGVRGHARFHGDLGVRVIAVRDLEDLEPPGPTQSQPD